MEPMQKKTNLGKTRQEEKLEEIEVVHAKPITDINIYSGTDSLFEKITKTINSLIRTVNRQGERIEELEKELEEHKKHHTKLMED